MPSDNPIADSQKTGLATLGFQPKQPAMMAITQSTSNEKFMLRVMPIRVVHELAYVSKAYTAYSPSYTAKHRTSRMSVRRLMKNIQTRGAYSAKYPIDSTAQLDSFVHHTLTAMYGIPDVTNAPTIERVWFTSPIPSGGAYNNGSVPWDAIPGRSDAANVSTPSENSVPSSDAGVKKIKTNRSITSAKYRRDEVSVRNTSAPKFIAPGPLGESEVLFSLDSWPLSFVFFTRFNTLRLVPVAVELVDFDDASDVVFLATMSSAAVSKDIVASLRLQSAVELVSRN